MKNEKIELEVNVYNRLKAIIEDQKLNIEIFEGEVNAIYESREPAEMISVLFVFPENIEFGALITQAINEEYNLC